MGRDGVSDHAATAMEEVTRFRDYDPFAWLYAHHWGGEFHSQVMGVLERLLLRLLPAGSEVLDLCCGDGRILRKLAERGFRVSGLDGSAEMLGYARKLVPADVPLHLADAREFLFPASFDAILSTFDSLNHVMTRRDLQKVFRNACGSLRSGGYFAFDVNRESAYTDLWSNLSSIVDAEVVSIARGEYDGRRRIATCDMTQFTKRQGQWERTDYTLRQKLHRHEHVMKDLEKVGFATVASFDAENDLGMKGDIGRYRTFYLARKK